ncbi:MAG: RHS repeat-associated core domain-containing protein [Phycisphaerae bacterium]|nr:RHS repeat-associated core domain-containing protein [Phycisphaerae bacterium]
MKVLRPGDFDGDGLVDQAHDWDGFNAAFLDPALAPLHCDVDLDGVITGSDYDLFAQLWEESLDAQANPPDEVRLGYAGYVRDPTTGLLLARHRWYDAGVGRWITRDPAGYVDGLSLYLYARGNPFGLVDPMGLDSLKLSEFVGYLFGFGEDGTAGKVWGAAGEGAISNPRKVKDAVAGVMKEAAVNVAYAVGAIDDQELAQNSAIYKAAYDVTLAGEGDALRGMGEVAKAAPGQVAESVKETASAVADGDLETIGNLSFGAGSALLGGAASARRAGAALTGDVAERRGASARTRSRNPDKTPWHPTHESRTIDSGRNSHGVQPLAANRGDAG